MPYSQNQNGHLIAKKDDARKLTQSVNKLVHNRFNRLTAESQAAFARDNSEYRPLNDFSTCTTALCKKTVLVGGGVLQ